MDAALYARLTIHRHWFTWPSWVFYAWFLLRCDEELIEDIRAGRYVL